jgi:protein ImuB
LDRFSPRIQSLDPHTALIDAAGTSRIWLTYQHFANDIAQAGGPGSQVALASTPLMALQVAKHYEGIQVIHPGDESIYIQALPIDVLPLDEAGKDTLFEWGIRRIDQFLLLPESAIAERFGQTGLAARQWALGQLPFLFQPSSDSSLPQSSLTLDDPVDTLEPLSFLLARLLQELSSKVPSTNHLYLDLHLEGKGFDPREFPLSTPVSDLRSLRKTLMAQLEKSPPRAPILALSLRAVPCETVRHQNHFFAAPIPSPEQLEPLLTRLHRLAGAENIGSPVPMDTHRPDSWILKNFTQPKQKSPLQGTIEKTFSSPLRYFRPALSVSVQRNGAIPVFLEAPGIRGPVQAAKGPWIIAGGWWLQNGAWHRSEWDVELPSGHLYRLYQNEQNHWFVEGYYD